MLTDLIPRQDEGWLVRSCMVIVISLFTYLL
jgi:hypothetical protein